jgi:hypothetical protein
MSVIKENNNTQFVEDIKKWIYLETQLKVANEKIKVLRDHRHTLNQSIISYMTTKNLLNAKIQVNNQLIKVSNKKEYGSLSYTYIEKCLEELIGDKLKVKEYIEYMKNKRDIENTMELKLV